MVREGGCCIHWESVCYRVVVIHMSRLAALMRLLWRFVKSTRNA